MNDSPQGYEYHLTLLSVRMRVKFPCKMKIQHNGSLLTAEIPNSNNQSKYIFNQQIILKSGFIQAQCFQFILHLVTDKGARYIGGVFKLYHAEMIRSQGQKLTVSLSKCVDSQAFCEVRVNQILTQRDSRNLSYGKRSNITKNMLYKPKQDLQVSYNRDNLYLTNQQSKTQYNFPSYQTHQKDWENRSKLKHLPPQPPNYSRVRTPSKYVKLQQPHFFTQQSEVGLITRQASGQVQIYKEGYQKLKQKYRRQADLTKQQTNKRLALQSSENNLKLQIMRLKLKLEEQDKALQDRTTKMKELQNTSAITKQKQVQNGFLREELHKRQINMQALQKTIAAMTSDLAEFRDMSKHKKNEQHYKLRELREELEIVKAKLQRKQKQLQHQAHLRKEAAIQKEQQITIKQQQIEKNKKLINDLEKAVQIKNNDFEKSLQNDKSNNKAKIQEQKLRIQKLQKQALALNEQKKEFASKMQQLKASCIQMEYEKKLINQSYESLQQEGKHYRTLKQKHNQLIRQHSTLADQHSQFRQQIEKLIQNKEEAVILYNQQIKEQAEHFRILIKQMEEKERKRITEITQMQSLLDQSKSQQEKLKKNVDSLSREVEQCKQREKNAKKAVRSKEHQSLGIQTEHATIKQKLKTIDQIYKLQADKLKDEADKAKQQLQQLSKRHQQLATQNHRLSDELNATKAKLQYAQQRSERDSNNLKEKQQQIQNLFKDSQDQISGLEKVILGLRTSQKQACNKSQKMEVETLRKEQKLQKSKRELKVMQQKCNNLESIVKTKTHQLQALNSEKQLLQLKLMEKETQFNQLQSQHIQLNTQKNKLLKIHQVLQDNFSQTKEEMGKLALKLQGQQHKQQQLSQQNNKYKQELTKLQLALNALKKDNDRNKQAIYENTQKYIASLLQQSQDKKTKDYTLSEIPSIIANIGKELKQMIGKLNDQIKQLQRQKQQLEQSMASSKNQFQTLQLQLKQHISQLEQQLEDVYQQKQTDSKNFTIIISQLHQKIKEKDYLQEELNAQVQELNFTINSVKLDCEALNEQNLKKIANLRKMNIALEDKIENFTILTSQLQQSQNKLIEQNNLINNEYQHLQQLYTKHQKSHLDLSTLQRQQEALLQVVKKQNKELTQKLSDCEMYLGAEKELNQKLKEQIQKEQRTCIQLKSFIGELMKQKQSSIKKDLQTQQSMTQIQANLLEQIKDKQLLEQEKQRISKLVQSQKELIKQYTASIKQYEGRLHQQIKIHTKSKQKLKQRQRELTSKQQALKKLEQKHQSFCNKSKVEQNQLQEQLSNQINTRSQQNKFNSQKITKIQVQLDQAISQKNILKADLSNTQEQLFKLGQMYSSLQDTSEAYRLQCEQLKLKINFIDNNLTELSDQVRASQEKLFQFSNQIYNLQFKLEAKEKEKNSRLEELNVTWNNKYQAMCEDYENKLELIEKQKDYFKSLSDQRDREVTKMGNYLKVTEQSQFNSRKSFEEQLKKQEQQKLSQISFKNNEIKKLSQQLRALSENFKSKESQSRRINNELEMSRKTITNLDIKLKQFDQKTKSMAKMYQGQIQQLKKKDAISKSLRQNFSNHIWNSERQTKKYIQNFIRTFLQINQDKNSQKIIQLARMLQNSILQAIAFTISEK